jgi:DNA-binding response OmpR family regulator
MSENSQKTILVVEDEDEIGSNMNAMLSRKGYRVLRASDAGGAINLAELDRPTLILTDLDLPTLDSLIQRIRAHETLKNLLLAVIDINHPPEAKDGLKILNNFDELDALLAFTSEG